MIRTQAAKSLNTGTSSNRLKPFCEKELGVKFTILHADKTYDEVFHHVITRGPHKGEVRGFAWAGMCVWTE